MTDSTRHFHALAFSPDGRTLIGGNAGANLYWWDVPSQTLSATSQVGEVFAAAFVPQPQTVAVACQRAIFLHTQKNEPSSLLLGHVGEIRGLAYSAHNNLLATGAQDGAVKVWDLPHPSALEETHQTVTIRAIDEGKRLLRVSRTAIERWDIERQALETTLHEGLAGVSQATIARDGSLVAIAGNEGLALWDSNSQQLTLLTCAEGITALAFSHDNHLLAVSNAREGTQSSVTLWEVATRQRLANLEGNEWTSIELAFSPDGKTLAVASWYEYGNIACQVHLWDVAERSRITDLKGHTKSVNSVKFSPDGKLLASTGSDNTVKIWNAHSYELIATLDGHTREPSCLQFAENSPRLFSGDAGGSILIWDLITEQEVGSLTGQAGSVSQMSISPDGQLLVSSSVSLRERPGEEIRCWRAQNEELLTAGSWNRPLIGTAD